MPYLFADPTTYMYAPPFPFLLEGLFALQPHLKLPFIGGVQALILGDQNMFLLSEAKGWWCAFQGLVIICSHQPGAKM